MAERFVKLYNKMLGWEWYDDANTCRVFIHCLLKANWQPTRWHGIQLEAGQFVTSLANLAKETTLTVRQVRTALEHLNSTNEVTSKCQGKIRIITVNSWNDYQGSDKVSDKQATRLRQGSDKVATTDTEDIEDKEDIEINNNIYNNRAFQKPSVEDVKAYCLERNNQVDPEAFVSFYDSKGWMIGKNKMKDWKAAVRTWERSRNKSGKENPTQKKNKFINFDERSYDYDELMKSATQ